MVLGVSWILNPFGADFFVRALVGGLLVVAICAMVGTWVVLRGMAFLGEALGHGMLPGVALASVAGVPVTLGAVLSAAAMGLGIGVATPRLRLSHDTSIGLFFVGMLATGVIIVSHSNSSAVDLTAILFGDVLAIRGSELVLLAVGVAVTGGVAWWFHRSFVALTFDRRVAHTLGLRPARAELAQVVLVTIAVVACYQAVGTLLVVGLLIAPPAAALPWAHRIPQIMLLAAALGSVAIIGGLLVSWHAGSAAGASIAAAAVGIFVLSAAAHRMTDRHRRIEPAMSGR